MYHTRTTVTDDTLRTTEERLIQLITSPERFDFFATYFPAFVILKTTAADEHLASQLKIIDAAWTSASTKTAALAPVLKALNSMKYTKEPTKWLDEQFPEALKRFTYNVEALNALVPKGKNSVNTQFF